MRLLKKLLVATTPKGAAALIGGGGTFSSLRELDDWYAGRQRPRRGVVITSPRAGLKVDTVRFKQVLLALIVIGALANLGSPGWFASFSAEVQNTNSSISSGTLTMSDEVNAGTTCLSANGSSQNNVNAGCASTLALTNVAPGLFGGTAQVTIQNTGSIDASKFYVYAPYVNSTLNAGLTSGGSVSSLTVLALEGAVTNGDSIVVTYGSHTQTFTASGATAAGATSITVTSVNANFSYPVGSTVQDTSSNTTASNTDCYDAKTTTGVSGSTKGTDLNFNPVAGNPFCSTVLMYVQETGTSSNYCWSGNGAGTAQCTAPVSVTLSAQVSGNGVTSLPVSALNGNVKSGDSVLVKSGTNTQTFVASAAAYFGATSISVTSQNANATYPIGSTVTNSSALSTLNIDSTNTISNFDTAHPFSGKVQLYPVTANGTIDNTATVELSRFNNGSYQRTFQVGLYLPAPAGTNQNPLQGLGSTFGLTWHMDQ